MNTNITRRSFLKNSALAAMTTTGFSITGITRTSAVTPFKRPAPPRFLLSLAAYSFRKYFNHSDAEKRIDLFDFIDFCSEHGCIGTELTSYYFPPNPKAEFLLNIKRHAFLRGTPISGTAVGNDFTVEQGEKRNAQIRMVKNWIDNAAIMGAPHIRVFAGNVKNGQTRQQAFKLCVEALEECSEYAAGKGVFLGLENHGGIVSESDGLLEIVKAVKNPWFGVNLDTGNFHTGDPYADIARCAPYAVNVQLKVEITPRGQGRVKADYKRIRDILNSASYQGYIALEYEAAEDPWNAIPPLLDELGELFAST
ncbi:MAG: sugar phosphate isomerase/epimerase [Verrucomicrobia bacterium]|nr:sugar phosphate isomerase/epimerase [Verrucomicrobiota bacterium]